MLATNLGVRVGKAQRAHAILYPNRIGFNKHSALRRIAFDSSDVDMAKISPAVRRLTASPYLPFVNGES